MARIKQNTPQPPDAAGTHSPLAVEPSQACLPQEAESVPAVRRLQLLSLARDRVPVLRAELEFWTLVLARLEERPALLTALPPPEKAVPR